MVSIQSYGADYMYYQKIKGAAHKNGVVYGMCKRGLSLALMFCLSSWNFGTNIKCKTMQHDKDCPCLIVFPYQIMDSYFSSLQSCGLFTQSLNGTGTRTGNGRKLTNVILYGIFLRFNLSYACTVPILWHEIGPNPGTAQALCKKKNCSHMYLCLEHRSEQSTSTRVTWWGMAFQREVTQEKPNTGTTQRWVNISAVLRWIFSHSELLYVNSMWNLNQLWSQLDRTLLFKAKDLLLTLVFNVKHICYNWNNFITERSYL